MTVSDHKCPECEYYLSYMCVIAAVFSVLATDAVAEVDMPIDACVTLNSGSASLATELVVSLSTANGTGETKHNLAK